MENILLCPSMRINDIGTFVSFLEQQNELIRISESVDPLLEIAAITERICRQPDGGKALLFENPRNSTCRVATNLFGSRRRTALALGVDDLSLLTRSVSALLKEISGISSGSLDQCIASLPAFAAYRPASARSALFQPIPPDLLSFPFLQNWPHDGSATGNPRYLTLPLVFTSLPDGSAPNCGMYRVQLHGASELAVRWLAGSGAARHHDAWIQAGKEMPVAIALGGDPALTFSAFFPLPGDLDEVVFAGFLTGTPLQMTPCRTVPLAVPAAAELVIEGYADLHECLMEGPFGNYTGDYAPAAPAPKIRVTSVSCRPDPVIPATIVGTPPQEDCWMAMAWERILSAFLQYCAPAVHDIHVPLTWSFRKSAILSLEKLSPDMVRETAALLLDTPWFDRNSTMIFVAEDTDPARIDAVSRYCLDSSGNQISPEHLTEKLAAPAGHLCRCPKNIL